MSSPSLTYQLLRSNHANKTRFHYRSHCRYSHRLPRGSSKQLLHPSFIQPSCIHERFLLDRSNFHHHLFPPGVLRSSPFQQLFPLSIMAYQVIERKIYSLGYCCPYIFFWTTRTFSHREVALLLSCSLISIRKWRQRYRRNEIHCLHQSYGCIKVALQHQRPATVPEPSADIDPVPDVELPGDFPLQTD